MAKDLYGRGNKSRVMIILIAVISVLILFNIYAFVIKPMFQNHVVEMQIQAQAQVLDTILLNVQQNGFVQIPLGNESLILVPYVPQEGQEQIETVE